MREILRRTQGEYQSLSAAVYAQDSWAVVPSLTLNFGVRWEMYENKNAAGETFIKVTDQFAPRIGVVWDPGGRGSSKVIRQLGRAPHADRGGNKLVARRPGVQHPNMVRACWWHQP